MAINRIMAAGTLACTFRKEGEIVVDFNKAYNPYCAYGSKFSFPIVPKANHLDTKILAGIKYKEKK